MSPLQCWPWTPLCGSHAFSLPSGWYMAQKPWRPVVKTVQAETEAEIGGSTNQKHLWSHLREWELRLACFMYGKEPRSRCTPTALHFCFIISWLVRKTQRDLYGSYFWSALCQTWWYLLGENWGRPLFNCEGGLLYDGENEGTDILGYYIQISLIHVSFKKIHWESLWNVPIIYTRSIKLILEIQLRFSNSDFRRKMFPDFSHYFSIYLHH